MWVLGDVKIESSQGNDGITDRRSTYQYGTPRYAFAQRAELGFDTLPENLLDATRELERDDVLRRALGTTRDGDYLDYFVACKRREVQAAHEQITQWELDRYLQLF